MTSVLLELFRHKTWATSRVLEFCQSIAAEHLEATQPGTFGSVRDTLTHLVNSDTIYYQRLTGEQMGPKFDGSEKLAALAERIAQLGPRWEAALDDPSLPDRSIPNPWGSSAGVALFAQAIHHADDHRTHILTILGARGLDVPELDIWTYGQQAGFVHADPQVV
jgi:uncharacterized damage-inducible protein DinB